MPIVEEIIITANNADANKKIDETNRKTQELGDKGALAGGKFQKQWATTFASFAIGAAAASRALMLLKSGLEDGLVAAFEKRAPDALFKFQQSWSDMNRAFGESLIGETAQHVDGLANAFSRVSSKIGEALGMIAKFTPAFALIKYNFAAINALLPDAATKAPAALDFTGTDAVGGFSVDRPGKPKPKEIFDKSHGKSMDEIMNGPEGPVATDWTQQITDMQDGMQRYSDARVAINENMQKRIADIETKSQEDMRQAQQQDIDERRAMMTAYIGAVAGVFQSFFDDVASGSAHSGKKFAMNMLRSIGQITFNKGVADVAAATASGFIYGNFTGLGPALEEVAVGSALMTGGALLGRGAKGGGGGGGGGGGPSRHEFSGGSGSSRAPGAPGGGSNQPVVFQINGVLTSKDAGREMVDVLNKARRQGLI